jgi:hypothetical protein
MKGQSREERLRVLHRLGVSHVYIHWGELARYRSPGNYGYSDYVTEEVVDELIREGLLGPEVCQFGDYGKLYPVVRGGREGAEP